MCNVISVLRPLCEGVHVLHLDLVCESYCFYVVLNTNLTHSMMSLVSNKKNAFILLLSWRYVTDIMEACYWRVHLQNKL